MIDHTQPFRFQLPQIGGIPSAYDRLTIRRLSSMKNIYQDTTACDALIAQGDPLLYEVYEIRRPENVGELLHGVTVLYSGKVGSEYFMTKGHFHAVLETGEVYYCLQGAGRIVMGTPEGDWNVQTFHAGDVVYVPPRWAHRTVNVGVEDLIFFFIYPGHAGHDYSTIEQQGFRKLIVEKEEMPQVIDNPRWQH